MKRYFQFGKAFLFFALATGISSCGGEKKVSEVQEEKAFDKANMDFDVKPGDDFFRYSGGAWMKNNPVPEEYTRYGAFEILDEQNKKNLQNLIKEAAAANAAEGTEQQKIGDFYNSGMDTAKINQLGVKPILPSLESIDAIKDVASLKSEINKMAARGDIYLFYFFASVDKKNSEMMIAKTWQKGLGLPDRDYYTEKENKRYQDIRQAYVEHIAKMFVLTGVEEKKATADAEKILKFETRIAEASNTRLENRNPHTTYNKMGIDELKSNVSNFDWDGFFKALNIAPTTIDVTQPKHLKELDKMLVEESIDTWKVYLKWHIIDNAANYLSSDFEQQNFAFYNTTLSGQKKMKPRWKRVLSKTSGALGEAIGKVYVEKHFPPEAKQRMLGLVENLRKALSKRIDGLDWMSDSTKLEAQAKLKKVNVKIGYPDKWRDYSNLKIEAGNYFGNVAAAGRFALAFNLSKIDKPVDPTEWGMTPQTVNAYYSPSRNEIVFPAAILQPPFFYLDADDAVNYGAIGVVIGHEITHGFDDQGRKYDKDGNLKDWWTKADSERFDKRTEIVVDQYNRFTVFDSLHVDGKLTLGENIADIGGLNISLQAFKMALEGKETPAKISDFDHFQRFFLSYAQVWRQNIRDKELMRRLKEDVHSPGEFRVNGALFNIPEFYEAFDIKEDNKLYLAPEKRANIW